MSFLLDKRRTFLQACVDNFTQPNNSNKLEFPAAFRIDLLNTAGF